MGKGVLVLGVVQIINALLSGALGIILMRCVMPELRIIPRWTPVQGKLVLNFAGFNAVKMLFWSAVINGLLAPPLILLVILLTSSRKVMGKRVNPPVLRYLGWATLAIMTAAAVGMIITS